MLSSIGQVVPQDVRRILVVRPNHRLGDQILIYPLIRELECLFPGAEIELLLSGNTGEELFTQFSSVSRIHELPRYVVRHPIRSAALIRSLRNRRYDLAVDPCAESNSSRILLSLLRARAAIGVPHPRSERHGEWAKLMFLAPRHAATLPVFLARHAVRSESRVDEIHYPKPDIGLSRFEIANGKRVLSASLPSSARGTIVLGIYADASRNKRLDTEWWERFLIGLDQSGIEASVIELLPDDRKSRLANAYPTVSISSPRKLAAVISQLDCFVSADCGVMYLAVASGAPTVGLFSATDRETYEPYGSRNHGIAVHAKAPETVAAIVARKLRPRREVSRQARGHSLFNGGIWGSKVTDDNSRIVSCGRLRCIFPTTGNPE